MAKLKIATAVMVAFFVMIAAGQSSAQSQNPTEEDIAEMQKVEVPDNTMKEFVALYKQLNAIHNDYMKQVQSAEDEPTKQKLVEKANSDIQQELDRSPLSRDDYNLIVSALPYNKRLQDQYSKYME